MKRSHGCRVDTGYAYQGYRALVMQNELLRVTLLLDKGGDIVEFLHKPSDTDFMWSTPQGLRPRRGKEGPFFTNYQGGWQEIFPNGGMPSRHQGISYLQHSESPQLPWKLKILKDSPGEILAELSARAPKSGLACVKRLGLKRGKGALFIEERITNTSKARRDFMWGHHPALGKPFLGPDCRLDLKGATAEFHLRFAELPRFAEGTEGSWPHLKDKDGKSVDISRFPSYARRSADMFYLKNLKGNWYGLTNAKTKVGFGMAWDLKTFPYLWFWQVFHGSMKAPNSGGTYNCAVEPFSSIPSGLANAHARGTHLSLAPGKSRSTWLTAVAYAGLTRVRGVSRSGRVR